jgi:UDP-xylose:glucoside alpha-1,3-xylosyltransferase
MYTCLNFFFIDIKMELNTRVICLLIFQTVLSDVDSLLYVDTDTLFLGPLEDVWRHFDLMNSSQMAALTPEHEDPNTGWYNRFAKHPYYGRLGKYFI